MPAPPTQRMGKTMIALAFIMALGLLTFFFNSVLEQRSNPNQNLETRYDEEQGYKEVVLKQNRGSHYVASGAINGYPVTFLLDTGATWVSIPERVANRIGLEKGVPMLASTANGTITTYRTDVERVALADIELKHIRASINPHMDGEEVLLGMSFLRELSFTQQGNRLILRQYQ